MYFGVMVPVALALLAINYELIKDSEYRKAKIRKEEKKAFIAILDEVKGRGADPEINDYYRKVKEKLND